MRGVVLFMDEFEFDAIVVGAGLGGICAAISLAQRGAHVALLEAVKFPRHKVCGEFLSPEIRRTFRRLKIDDEILQHAPSPISEARIVVSQNAKSSTRNSLAQIASAPTLKLPLPAGAIGLSRFTLDQILWDAAARCGVKMFAETRVRTIEKQNDNFVVRTSKAELNARFVLAAPGRNSRFATDEYSNNAANSAKKKRYIGFKTHFGNVQNLDGAVEMYPFEGGYCGTSAVENGRFNVCLLARYETIDGHSPDEFWAQLLEICPALKVRFAGATQLIPWLTTANISFGRAQPTRSDGVLFCGDACGYIHPLTGDGMAMAARSGELAASIVAASLRDGLAKSDVAPLYERTWRREFSSRLSWAARLEPLMTEPNFARLAIPILKSAPQLGHFVIAKTRG